MASERKSNHPRRRISGILASAAAGFALLLALASCTGRLEASIRGDMSARLALRMEVPEALAARVRQIGGISAKSSLFDSQALKEEFDTRKSIFLVDVSSPSLESLTSVIWIPSMSAFAADRSIVPAGMIELKSIPAGSLPAQRELTVSITRDNAAAAFALFPGMNRKLIDSLAPPALEEEPVTTAEYRMNLETVIIGRKTMPAFDACSIDLSITAPRSITSASGGSYQGQVFKMKIPLFDLLTLEKPLRFTVRWAE